MDSNAIQQRSIPQGRRKLATVIRGSGDIIRIEDVVSALPTGRSDAAKLLSRWAGQGWLRRVGPGAYVAVSLDSLESERILDDPWILVPLLYAPAYIGGWTAAEYWDLTEQLFRQILVITTKTVRRKREIRDGAQFIVRHIQKRKFFGTKAVWRGRSKVLVSDVHRTIIDMLDEPSIGGGIQHVADCLAVYLRHPDRDDEILIDYAEGLDNGAIFKRLGFLAEEYPDTGDLTEACLKHLTKGNAKIDPALECPRLISKWRLRIPLNWTTGERSG